MRIASGETYPRTPADLTQLRWALAVAAHLQKRGRGPVPERQAAE
jgi:hypothetical protein